MQEFAGIAKIPTEVAGGTFYTQVVEVVVVVLLVGGLA